MLSFAFILLFSLLAIIVVSFLIFQYNQAERYKRRKYNLAIREKANRLKSSRPRNETDEFPFSSYIEPPQYYGPNGYKSLPPQYAGRLDYSTITGSTPQMNRRQSIHHNNRPEQQLEQSQQSQRLQALQQNHIHENNSYRSHNVHPVRTSNHINNHNHNNVNHTRGRQASQEINRHQIPQSTTQQQNIAVHQEDPGFLQYLNADNEPELISDGHVETNQPQTQSPSPSGFDPTFYDQQTPSKVVKTQDKNPEAPKSILRNSKKRKIPLDRPPEDIKRKKVLIQDPEQKQFLKPAPKQRKRKNSDVLDTRTKKKQRTTNENKKISNTNQDIKHSEKKKTNGMKRPLAKIGSGSSVFSKVKRRRINNEEMDQESNNDSYSNPSTPRANRIAYKIHEMKHDDENTIQHPKIMDSIQASPIPNASTANFSPGLNTPAKMSPIASKISELWSSIFSPTPQKKRKMRNGRSGFALRKGLRPDQRVLTNTDDIKAHQDRANAVMTFAEREHAKKLEQEKKETNQQKIRHNINNNTPDSEKSEKKVRFSENNAKTQNNKNSQKEGFSFGVQKQPQTAPASSDNKSSSGGFNFDSKTTETKPTSETKSSKGFSFGIQPTKYNKQQSSDNFSIPSKKNVPSSSQQSGSTTTSGGFKFGTNKQTVQNNSEQVQPSQQSTAPSSDSFKFGSTSQPSEFQPSQKQKPSSQNQTKPASNGFQIGQQQDNSQKTTQSSANPGFSFPTNKTDNQLVTQPTTNGAFGQTQKDKNSGFIGFGNKASAASNQQTQQQNNNSKPGGFGAQKNPGFGGGGSTSGFGTKSVNSGNGFGKPNNNPGFNANQNATPTSSKPSGFGGFGGFGTSQKKNNNPTQSSNNGFSAKSTIADGSFGVSKPNSGFGNTGSGAPNQAKNSFGSQPSARFNMPNPNSGINSNQPTNGNGGGFGQQTSQNKSSGFGGFSKPASNSGFGNQPQPQQQQQQQQPKKSFGFTSNNQSSVPRTNSGGFSGGNSTGGFGRTSTSSGGGGFGQNPANGTGGFNKPSAGNTSFSQGAPVRAVRGTPRRRRRGRR